jgi:hypothetical protein
MFLKRLERRKNGKPHTYWALVESIRTARGSRHRLVAYLGELRRSERSGWAQVGRRLDRGERPQPSLFDPPHSDEPEEGEPVLVRLKGIKLQRLRDFGDVWLGLGLWRLLGLDTLLTRLIPDGREEVPWPALAAILTIARFCEPSSELHIADTWYARTALEDLLGVAPERVHHRRLYEGLDALLPHKPAIEAHRKQRLGRLRERNWRAAGAFDVRIQRLPRPQEKVHLSLSWSRRTRWSEWAALSEGCYLLRTNLKEADPARLWKQYIQLTEAEWAFRIHKDELGLRPIWHHKPERVQAHILVCFLAYVLWKALAQWMRCAGLGDAPRTLLEELAKIKSGDVVLPARVSHAGGASQSERTIRLRCVTAPDEAQKMLLNRLGVQLPQRLRRIDEVAEM